MRTYRKPHKIRKKTPFFKKRFFWIFILVLIFFFGSAYLVSFAPFFNIKEIQISGNRKVSADDIKQLVNEKIVRNFGKFSSKSIFLSNLKEAKASILNKFPQIEEISLKRKFPGSIVVEAKERIAVANFCPDSECFLIDKNGVVFEKIDIIFSEFPKIKNVEGRNIFSLGEKVIDENILKSILDIKNGLTEKSKIIIEEFNMLSLQRLNVKTKENWEIYFNLNEDLKWQTDKLILVLENEIPSEKRRDLEYIDLRFSRVYFKYKNLSP